MIDSFPYEEWGDSITAFWTFGPENSAGTYILTVLGVIVMIVSLIGWVWLENQKLQAQADLLRSAGGIPLPGGDAPGLRPGQAQPPLAGPSTHPGD